jgi:hypothetical protein
VRARSSLQRDAAPDQGASESLWQLWWPRLRLGLTLLFFGAVAVLLVINAREVEWGKVVSVMRGYGSGTLLAAAGLAAVGHVFYTAYDLLGRRYTGHGLPWPRVMSIAFVSYAFNLNMGPIIGAMAFRFRLYSRFGLGKGVISRVLGFSIVSNWLGYLLVGGILFAAEVVELPPSWAFGTAALQVFGVGMILLVVAYVWLCGRAQRRSFNIRDVEIELPPVRMAVLQLAVSCACWTTIGVVLYLLLQQQIPFPTVFGVLLLAAVAALATHIPAGLGVLEATFVLLLGHLLPHTELLAAVLAYRALYYLAPLLLAVLMFLWLETRSKQ